MTMPSDSFRLREALAALQRLIAQFEGQGVVIGGIAASVLGKARATADVDGILLVSTDDLPRLLTMAAKEGLVSRIPDAEEFARQRRVLLLRHAVSGVNVDISLGVLPFEIEAVQRSLVRETDIGSVRIPTPEDLIIMKAVAHRPRDMEDIDAILEANPDLDRQRIQFWVQQFAEALDMPELWDDVSQLLERKRE